MKTKAKLQVAQAEVIASLVAFIQKTEPNRATYKEARKQLALEVPQFLQLVEQHWKSLQGFITTIPNTFTLKDKTYSLKKTGLSVVALAAKHQNGQTRASLRVVKLVQPPPDANTDTVPTTASSRRAGAREHARALTDPLLDAKPYDEAHGNGDKKVHSLAASASVITDSIECDIACAQLREESLIAVDCEGINLGRPGGRLSLVQIACASKAVIFDVLTNPGLFSNGLHELLCDSSIVKAIHDCRMDVAALAQHGIQIASVLDTQVVYRTVHRRVAQISLKDFVRELTGCEHAEKDRAPHLADPSFWGKRPLTAHSITYALDDVKLLLPAAVQLMRQLTPQQVRRAHVACDARTAEIMSKATGTGLRPGAENIQDLGDILKVFSGNGSRQNSEHIQQVRTETVIEFDDMKRALPDHINDELETLIPDAESSLVDVVMDLERPVMFIRARAPSVQSSIVVSSDDLEHVLSECGQLTDANRACIGESLHRCSVIKDPTSSCVVGITLRLSRIVKGLANVIGDLLSAGSSVLLVGPPGRGKTTLLRDIANFLADRRNDRRVMIVDTNNEIGGEAVVPHHAIGRARRMKVGMRSNQYHKMLEAVQNHTPEVLIIDEIGTSKEVTEAVGIQQRGVQLIATTHGRTLTDIIQNPHVRNLLGGVNAVILSAAERLQEGASAKTRLERRMPPAFDAVVEILAINKWRVHLDIESTVDAILRGLDEVVECEIRELDAETGQLRTSYEPFPDPEDELLQGVVEKMHADVVDEVGQSRV